MVEEVKIGELVKTEAEEAEKRKEAEKKLRRVELEREVKTRYDKKAVASIVSKLKHTYEERGFVEEEAHSRGLKLKKMVAGRHGIELDQRTPKELVMSKGFPRLVGRVFTQFPFLNRFVSLVAMSSSTKSLLFDLDSANMQYSTLQYCSICFVASVFSTILLGLLSAALFFAGLGPGIAEIFGILNPVIQLVFSALLVLVVCFFVFVLSLIVGLRWPSYIAIRRGIGIDKDLAFALRHMATELKAGIGVHKTMGSIEEAGYGVLSEEFSRTLKQIEKGVSTDDALENMSLRSPSKSLIKAMRHMIRVLKTGGNLSEVMEDLADDVAFELRMRTRDFVERLSVIGLFYMMSGVVFPVFIAVLAGVFNAVPGLGMQTILSADMLFLAYFIFIPTILVSILYAIHMLDPM